MRSDIVPGGIFPTTTRATSRISTGGTSRPVCKMPCDEEAVSDNPSYGGRRGPTAG